MKIKFIIGAILILFCIKIQAQDHTNYNLYVQNPILYNPAYTFSQYKYSGYLNSHLQWAGFDGAPIANSFGVYGNIAKKMGLGLVGYQNKQGLNTQTNLNLAYAYNLAFSDEHFLSFGLNLGTFMEGLDYTKVQFADFTDDWFLENGNKSTSFAARFGIKYHIKGFEVAIAMPQLYQRNETNLHTITVLSYDWKINDSWKLKPSAMVRYTQFSGVKFDVNAEVAWKNIIFTQIGYRHQGNIMATIGFNWKDYSIAYAYQYDNSDLSQFASRTNEIQLFYRLPYREKRVIDECEDDCQCCHCRSKCTGRVSKEDKIPADKIQMLVSVKDKKSSKAVEGNVKIYKDNKLVVQEKANDKGEAKTLLTPGVYLIEVQTKGYLPISETVDLTSQKTGEQYEYKFTPEKLEKGLVFTFANISFEVGSDKIVKSSYEILDVLPQIFIDNPTMKVEVAGHTDNIGTEEVNTKLSEKRAKAVADYLISKGVNKDQLVVKGYGSTKPVADNSTEEGRIKNRRVEFTILELTN